MIILSFYARIMILFAESSVCGRIFSRDVEAIGQAVASITADDALGFIRHCGYAATSG
jgi:hypothetical protein